MKPFFSLQTISLLLGLLCLDVNNNIKIVVLNYNTISQKKD